MPLSHRSPELWLAAALRLTGMVLIPVFAASTISGILSILRQSENRDWYDVASFYWSCGPSLLWTAFCAAAVAYARPLARFILGSPRVWLAAALRLTGLVCAALFGVWTLGEAIQVFSGNVWESWEANRSATLSWLWNGLGFYLLWTLLCAAAVGYARPLAAFITGSPTRCRGCGYSVAPPMQRSPECDLALSDPPPERAMQTQEPHAHPQPPLRRD